MFIGERLPQLIVKRTRAHIEERGSGSIGYYRSRSA
jgi:hypothetical protein